MHEYNERGTFKIYRSFVFGQANFQWGANIKIAIFQTLNKARQNMKLCLLYHQGLYT